MTKSWIVFFVPYSLFALTTLNVTTDSDNDPGGTGEPGDLRYYLNTMNQGLNTLPDDYEILFDHPMTIQLNGILPIINNSSNSVNITIGNPGSTPTVTIDGNGGSFPGFFIPMGNVTIRNMIFQNLTAKGGDGGNGISGGGGGMGAGGAIYAPQSFLNGLNPSVTLMNVLINSCSAVGGNGGNYSSSSITGDEGGGGGGGFSGNGGSVTTTGSTGGGGGGGFGGNGGDVTLSTGDGLSGGGGGGGGGIGSRASIGSVTNSGNGGSDQNPGSSGNLYGITVSSGGTGAGGYPGGSYGGGGGGGGSTGGSTVSGGGGGGSIGEAGLVAEGSLAPGGSVSPSGGKGGDGGGGGGAGVVQNGSRNGVDGQAGDGGYGGGGGGGAGTGSSDTSYTVQGGAGGVGGGGGGGGVNQSVSGSAQGGDSGGGGGGGGGGPSQGSAASGGRDSGNLGGGDGGEGADNTGFGFGGGGGGGGAGLGGAIFVDSFLNFTIEALPGIPTVFNTSGNTVQAGVHGTGGDGGGSDGSDGSASGNSIFLRTGSSLILKASDSGDLLTLGDEVAFADDTGFSGMGAAIFVRGNGTVVYNGTTDYQGRITINNANFTVNGLIEGAAISVCRDIDFSTQRGTLSGRGTLTGDVFVNSGTISPDTGETLTLGSLSLQPADPINNTLGSLVHIEINSGGTSLVAVERSASLAGILEIRVDPDTPLGVYTLLTSSGITGVFDSVTFVGETPNYSLSYLPAEAPTFVQLNFLGYAPAPPSNLRGKQKKNNFGFTYELYNRLAWDPGPSPETVGYCIYRDGEKIKTVDASTHVYKDHDRKKGVSYLYSVTALNSAGKESTPVTIIITP